MVCTLVYELVCCCRVALGSRQSTELYFQSREAIAVHSVGGGGGGGGGGGALESKSYF